MNDFVKGYYLKLAKECNKSISIIGNRVFRGKNSILADGEQLETNVENFIRGKK